MNKEEIQKAMELVNANKDNPLIEQYYDALHIVLEAHDNSQKRTKNGNYYKSDDNLDYYIVEPTEIIDIENGNYVFRQTGYDAYACNRDTDKPTLLFCRRLCNYTLDKIKNVIDEYIKEVNNNES